MKIELLIFIFLQIKVFSVPLELDLSHPAQGNRTNDSFNYTLNTEISYDLTENTQYLFTLKIAIGSPFQYFDLLFDTGSLFLWVPSNSSDSLPVKRFRPDQSSTFTSYGNSMHLVYGTAEITGTSSADYISLGNPSLKETSAYMKFLLAESIYFPISKSDGIIGFGRVYDGRYYHQADNSWSLIHSLKSSKVIERNVFSQKIINGSNTAKLYIGDYHADFKNDNSSNAMCHLLNKDKFWSSIPASKLWTCRLSYVAIGEFNEKNITDAFFSFQDLAIFDTGSNYIYAPSSFESFIDAYTNISTHNKCKKIYRPSKIFYVCEETYVRNVLPEIGFVFNGYVLRLKKAHLWETFAPLFLRFAIIIEHDSNLLILGQPFFTNYHILFDQEQSQMQFAADNPNDIINVRYFTSDDDFLFQDYILWFLLVVFLIVIVLIILFCVYLKRRQPPNMNYMGFPNQGNAQILNINTVYPPPSV